MLPGAVRRAASENALSPSSSASSHRLLCDHLSPSRHVVSLSVKLSFKRYTNIHYVAFPKCLNYGNAEISSTQFHRFADFGRCSRVACGLMFNVWWQMLVEHFVCFTAATRLQSFQSFVFAAFLISTSCETVMYGAIWLQTQLKLDVATVFFFSRIFLLLLAVGGNFDSMRCICSKWKIENNCVDDMSGQDFSVLGKNE